MARLFERSLRLEVPVERAFDFYGDAGNLEPMTPPWLRFRLVTPGPLELRAGALLDYRLRLHGVPLRWRARIEAWEPPNRFVDVQLRGPYSLWEHTHLFEEDGEGATLVRDRIRYAVPLGPIGAAAERLFVRRDLERIFDFRSEVAAARLGR